MIKRSLFLILGLILIVTFLPNTLDAQCAMCKASVESSANGPNSVASGINKGILYLMAVPYVLLAFIFRKQIVSLWKSFKSKRTTDIG